MICLVTGGTSGIGEAIAKELAQKEHKVYASGRNPQQEKVSETFSYIKMDVQSDSSVQQAIEKIIDQEGRLDVIVNSAGLGIAGPIEETPIQSIQNVFDTNFYGIVRICQSALPFMRQQKSGLIINISSIASEMGLPFRGYYSASKAAVDVFTESLRMEVEPFNVKVCTVQPGDYNTNISKNRSEVECATDSVYLENYQKVRNLVNEEVGSSGDPKDVAKQILKIIHTKNPSVKYKVGPIFQVFATFAKKIMPQKLFEYLVMKNYKLK